MTWKSFSRAAILLFALVVVDKGFSSANRVLSEENQIPSISEMVGMDGVIEALKDRGVPMTPPVLFGALLALALLPKATALSIPAVKAGTRGSWRLGGSLARTIRRTPAAARYVRDHPKASAVSTVAVLGTLLTGAAIFQDDVPYASESVEYVQSLVNTTIEWSRTEVDGDALRWWLEAGLAAVALVVFFTNKQRIGRLFSTPAAPALAPVSVPPQEEPRTEKDEYRDLAIDRIARQIAHEHAHQAKDSLDHLTHELSRASEENEWKQGEAQSSETKVNRLNKDVQNQLRCLQRACSVIPQGERREYQWYLDQLNGQE